MNFGFKPNTTLTGFSPVSKPSTGADAGWGTVTGLPAPLPLNATDGQVHKGILFQGAGQANYVTNNGDAQEPLFQANSTVRAQNFSGEADTSSTPYVTAENFNKVVGGYHAIGEIIIPPGLL